MMQTITIRALNRATLARQGLLARQKLPLVEAVGRFGWLQAQLPASPALSLWTRVDGFSLDAYRAALSARQLVRAPFLRNTLHLVPASDYLRYWPIIRLALEHAFRSFFRPHQRQFDRDHVLTAARSLLADAPRTNGELGALLTTYIPEAEASALAYAARTFLPLVQVPDERARWGFPANPAYTLAETWLGQPVADRCDVEELVLRYLAAFGPATVKDIQAWLGARDVGKALRADLPALCQFRGPDGDVFYDNQDAPRPDEDIPAPPRLLPEFDALLLAHADRSRIIAPEYRRAVFLSAGRVRATILVDGMVAGTWSMHGTTSHARLAITPFRPLTKATSEALVAEAEALLAVLAPGVPTLAVDIVSP